MKLNTKSYAHVQIRLLCGKLSLKSGLRLKTNLSEEFNKLEFENELSYLIIDYKKGLCITMAHKLNEVEKDYVNDINDYLNWLETGNKYSRMFLNKRRKK